MRNRWKRTRRTVNELAQQGHFKRPLLKPFKQTIQTSIKAPQTAKKITFEAASLWPIAGIRLKLTRSTAAASTKAIGPIFAMRRRSLRRLVGSASAVGPRTYIVTSNVEDDQPRYPAVFLAAYRPRPLQPIVSCPAAHHQSYPAHEPRTFRIRASRTPPSSKVDRRRLGSPD